MVFLQENCQFFLQQEVSPGNQFRDNPRFQETPRTRFSCLPALIEPNSGAFAFFF
jgi:hypothetical protein